MKKIESFGTNTLWHYANQYRQYPTSNAETETINMTATFYDELEQMIKEGELIIISVVGKVRIGKTTLALAIAMIIHALLKKHRKLQNPNEPFGLKNIARDDQEKSVMMRNPNLQNTVVVTDEKNAMEETGENTTTEQALNRAFSDIQAARYVHSVSCSPAEIIDANSDIILNVIATDKRTMTTRAQLYYRYYDGETQTHQVQLLGYVDTNVQRVIGTWENKVKKHYYKPHKNAEDQKAIRNWAKKDWYTQYVIKKHQKMDLITKHAIWKPRQLTYASIVSEAVAELKNIAKTAPTLLTYDIARNYVKMKAREHKTPMSIIGEDLATKDAMGILNMYKAYYKTKAKQQTIKQKLSENKITHQQWKTQDQEMETMAQQFVQTAKAQEEELEKYEKINAEYHTHEAGRAQK